MIKRYGLGLLGTLMFLAGLAFLPSEAVAQTTYGEFYDDVNLLDDGGFEGKLRMWQRRGGANWALYQNAPYSGGQYLAFNKGANGVSVYQDRRGIVNAGEMVIASVMVRSQGSSATGTLCVWGLYGGNENICTKYSANRTWSKVNLKGKFARSHNQLRFEFYPDHGTTNVDNAWLTVTSEEIAEAVDNPEALVAQFVTPQGALAATNDQAPSNKLQGMQKARTDLFWSQKEACGGNSSCETLITDDYWDDMNKIGDTGKPDESDYQDDNGDGEFTAEDPSFVGPPAPTNTTSGDGGNGGGGNTGGGELKPGENLVCC